ncbi:hypothetical protein [Clostridium beijerinckii]|uniref:Uncharacterized protein n=1 Tax=Clostridium beijerinckii TaxID=1520 RepID=A0A9Q5CQ51_CLOBE|nr:hypothetical protein [Clostridium beijerinckii]AQS06348.1 hypothetical protein CLBIJ_37950 [Clostridium beijerinckii]MBA2885721.1 hypothetical protein [Clostridium beijerinckii]MBA2900578.1 hypothetical protein [Clostridium beijerinckii]MBA2910280.1 hypothetical protein [Clostridium beijerinckii]MBA9014036.1 hypothetical protein [Clostridium beijerinckii]
MEIHNHNLNIHYSSPEDIWDKLAELYSEMPGWSGFIDGIPHWYAQDNDKRIINASVEPSGLQFYAEMQQEEWNTWFELFKTKASATLGLEIGEPEDGFEFHIYS